jgi:hypothetical protein
MKYKAQLDTGDYHEISEDISRVIMYNKGKKINLKINVDKLGRLYITLMRR